MAAVHRLKERGGAGAKITAPRSPDHFLAKATAGAGIGRKPAGKENERSLSRERLRSSSALKRPVQSTVARPGIGEPAKDGGDSRRGGRSSTSAAPAKGKSADLSQYSRFISDMRSDRGPVGGGLDKRVMEVKERGMGREKRASFGSVLNRKDDKKSVYGSKGLEVSRSGAYMELKLKDMVKNDGRSLNYRKGKVFLDSKQQGHAGIGSNDCKVTENLEDKFCLDELLPFPIDVNQKEVNGANVLVDRKPSCLVDGKIGFHMPVNVVCEKPLIGVAMPGNDVNEKPLIGSAMPVNVVCEKSLIRVAMPGNGVNQKPLIVGVMPVNVVCEKPLIRLAMPGNDVNQKSLIGGAMPVNDVIEKPLIIGGSKPPSDASEKPQVIAEVKNPSTVSTSVETADKHQRNAVALVSGNVKRSVCLESGIKLAANTSLTEVEAAEDLKDQKGSAALNHPQVAKYPSRLRERLAVLEGRVNKIASEIKQTKDILDLNNPELSKHILSDIQEKIMGIEKAVNNVVVDTNINHRMPEILSNNKGLPSQREDAHQEHACDSKRFVGTMNHEEIETRFYPHQRLLKGRVALDTVGEKKPTDFQEPKRSSIIDDQSSVPIDENPIAIEFLASLSDKQSKVNAINRKIQLPCTMNAAGTDTTDDRDKQSIIMGSICEKPEGEVSLIADEKLTDFDDENRADLSAIETMPDSFIEDRVIEIGNKSATGGWFVSEGESVLLAHGDGSCSFYDITNSEEKADYSPSAGVPYNLWGDCWLIHAPGSDGCFGRYIVAASAGGTLDSGFCSWDFYAKDIKAFHVEDSSKAFNCSTRTVLGVLNGTNNQRSNHLQNFATPNQQWWYRPCGPLLVSTATCQKTVNVYDIRDGEFVMMWDVQKPVLPMDYSSPLQWRNRGKIVIAETDGISLWDVNSLTPHPLLSVSAPGKKISALHVNNTDGELGGGVRQRVSSSEAEGNDGAFCTQDSVNVLDLRLPSGIGLKIAKHGTSNNSAIYSRGDAIFLGGTDCRLAAKRSGARTHIQQFSLRKGSLQTTYLLPESGAHSSYSSITQAWGNSQYVMGISGLGLFVFDPSKEEVFSSSIYQDNSDEVSEVIGPDDLYSPSFDYLASRVLIISRDRPALWRYLL